MSAWQEVAPLRVEKIRLQEGDYFALTVDAQGRPTDWPNQYCSSELRPTFMSHRTMAGRMAAVCLLYNWAAARGIDIQERIQTAQFFDRDEINALRAELRLNLAFKRSGEKTETGGSRKPVVSPSVWKSRCTAVRDYLKYYGDIAIQRMSARDTRLVEARLRLDNLRAWISAKIIVRKHSLREGLEPEARETFLKAITPGSPSNPFEPRLQERNYALFMLYYDGGPRKSEALIIKGQDVVTNGNEPMVMIHRRPDDKHERRKDEPRTKTLAHPVPLTPRAQRALDNYITGSRREYAPKKCPYVFVSQQGKALSKSSVTYLYRQLRKVPGISQDFSTHIIRYTWNDRFGEAAEAIGMPEPLETQARNQSEGWAKTSRMGENYQRGRNKRAARKVMLAMQDESTGGAEP